MDLPTLAKTLAAVYQVARPAYDWATDTKLRRDVRSYMSDLESRRVLYDQWQYEDIYAVAHSLEEILQLTRDLRSKHHTNRTISQLLMKLIRVIQNQLPIIRGANISVPEGSMLAYRALVAVRIEAARALALLCGLLSIMPPPSMERFVMEMAVVRPRA